jgi:hypothetical protein
MRQIIISANTKFLAENYFKKDNLGNLAENERIIIKFILEK